MLDGKNVEGLALVVSDRAGAAADIVRDCETGFLVPFLQVDAFSERLETLVSTMRFSGGWDTRPCAMSRNGTTRSGFAGDCQRSESTAWSRPVIEGRVCVTTPYREASIQHIARALDSAGALAGFLVPLDLRRNVGIARKRTFEPSGVSIMPFREISLSLAYRLTRRSAGPLVRRAIAFDELAAQRIGAIVPAAVVGMPYASVASFQAVKRCGGVAVLNHVNADLRTENDMFRTEGAFGEIWGDDVIGRVESELESADAVFVPSTFVRDDLAARGVSTEKIRVIPYGVDSRQFVPSEGPRKRSELHVLYVGQVGARKGLPSLIDALAHVDAPAAHLTVVGPITHGGRGVGRLASGVDFVGRVDQQHLTQLYAEADVFALPSLAEGMALVVLEAMAAGLPVIVTQEAGYDGIVREGIEGFIVPTRRPDVIAERLGRLARDPVLRAQMGTAARARAEIFSWERFEAAVGACLSDLLARQGAVL